MIRIASYIVAIGILVLFPTQMTLAAEEGRAIQASAMPVSAAQPQRPDGAPPAASLYLELVVNGTGTGRVIAVEQRDGHFYLLRRDLAMTSLQIPDNLGETVAIDQVPGITVEYEQYAQQLRLMAAPSWFARQVLNSNMRSRNQTADTAPGLLLNYDAYTTYPSQGQAYTSVSLEQRIFGSWGSFYNFGVEKQSFGANAGSKYLRYDTAWTYSDENRMFTVTAGDSLTGALPWTNSVRLGGFTISRNFSLRPDLITYPLPEFAGQAAVPTAVDLFINGSESLRTNVGPGPFTINATPTINGAGEATVVTTDAQGRTVTTHASFYVANTLLRKGTVDFSLSSGFARRAYGLQMFSYGKPLASGTVRYGLANVLTVDGHLEGGSRLGAGGLGADVAVWRFGTVNAAMATSQGLGQAGRQYSIGYGYNARKFGINAQHLERTSGFRDLSVYDLAPGITNQTLYRRIDQVTAACPFYGGGTIGGAYFYVVAPSGVSHRVVNMSHSRPFFHGTSLTIAVNGTTQNGRLVPSVQVQLLIPWRRHGTIVASGTDDPQFGRQVRAQYSEPLPVGGGLGWNLGYSGGQNQYTQADLTWRTRYLQVSGGTYGAFNNTTKWFEVSGSAIVIGKAGFLANTVSDSFVLVSTEGQKNVPVLFENQVVGKTNRLGYLLVPRVPSYYAAKYSIDPLGLPADAQVEDIDRRISVKRNSGTILKFPIKTVSSGTITLVDDKGQPLPLGTSVRLTETGRSASVGWDGIVYFEELAGANHLRATLPNGQECTASFLSNTTTSATGQYGPLTCQ